MPSASRAEDLLLLLRSSPQARLLLVVDRLALDLVHHRVERCLVGGGGRSAAQDLAIDDQRDLDVVGVGCALVRLAREFDRGVRRSSRSRSSRSSFRSAYSRTRSGTSAFLPLTIVLTRTSRRRRLWRRAIRYLRRVPEPTFTEYTRAAPDGLIVPARRRSPTPPAPLPAGAPSRTRRAWRPSSRRRRRGGPTAPRSPCAAAGRRGARNAPVTLAARSSRPSSNCATVARERSSASANGRPRPRAATVAMSAGLVVAALPLPVSVDGHRHDDLRAHADSRPAPRDGRSQRFGQAALAGVLQVVERSAHRAGERGAPFQLEERRRQVGRQPDRRATGQVQPRVERRQARVAQRQPSRPQPAQAAGNARSMAADAALEQSRSSTLTWPIMRAPIGRRCARAL